MSNPDLRICFVGDSFINGTGDSTLLGWTGRVCQFASQRGVPLTYYNLGVRRETSADIGVRWQFEVMARLPEGCDGAGWCFPLGQTIRPGSRAACG
ncbi:hypothetical protein [Leptolyngbya sp. O-77]|uniref:hypothetical protein n=1 Tax=Leptolyngbya sp. O-77 TaxID=1080068 RepID=UPI00074D42FE|nr:hypothetical protein [Leptolyngbya sp. O-77]BAU41680.1 hypothetical protein O77CONTIG1_01492 [Leptolyngbya sp. O-77]